MISVLPAISESSEKAETVYKSGDYSYTLDSKGAIITAYNGMDSELEVPYSIDGHPVKAIGDNAFSNCENLTSVTLPEGLETIGNGAFACTNLTSVALPNGLKLIGDLAFEGCMRLSSISLPNGLESIGNYAFHLCMNLTSLALPEGLEAVGDGAFSSCSNLVSVTVPDSVETMGSNPFFDCETLEEILVSSGNPLFSQIDGVLFDKAGPRLLSYPAGKKGMSYIVPAGVKSIGYGAFCHCKKLVTVTLPDSVEKMDGNPFIDCESLAEILVAPDNPMFTQIDGVLFNKAKTILLIYPMRKIGGVYAIPAGVKSIGESAFKSCYGPTSIVLPEGLEFIGDLAFESCQSLTSIVLPEGLESIGCNAFVYCVRLTSITLPASIMSIGINAFDDNIMLTVTRDSYAEVWAMENGFTYQYPDSAD
jgi:hypothetical protein